MPQVDVLVFKDKFLWVRDELGFDVSQLGYEVDHTVAYKKGADFGTVPGYCMGIIIQKGDKYAILIIANTAKLRGRVMYSSLESAKKAVDTAAKKFLLTLTEVYCYECHASMHQSDYRSFGNASSKRARNADGGKSAISPD